MAEKLQLTVLQDERDEWVARNFEGGPMPDALLGAVEELGELAHHYLKSQQNIRGTQEDHMEGMGDAVADCVIYLAGVASFLGLDFGVLVQETWDMVKTRDWVTFPTDGRTS